MYDRNSILSMLKKLDIEGGYRDTILDIIISLSKKIDDAFNKLNIESNRLRKAMTHIAFRGKFLRGVYTYLVSSGLGAPKEPSLTLATAVELYHMASLIHDDIIDHADFRRGVESVHKRYGLEYALIAGDALIIYSNYIVSKLGGEVIRILAESGLKLSDGEALELETGIPNDLEHYNKIVYLKTASFFEGIMISSAHISGNDHLRNLMRELGRYIGFSFQYRDDILDYVGEPSIMGKPKGADKYKSNILTILIKKYGYTLDEAINKVNDLITVYIDKALNIIKKVDMNIENRNIIIELTNALRVRII